jgi:hypothetical protein
MLNILSSWIDLVIVQAKIMFYDNFDIRCAVFQYKYIDIGNTAAHLHDMLDKLGEKR